MFGILKRLISKPEPVKPVRRTRGKGRKIDGNSGTHPFKPEYKPELEPEYKPEPTATIQEGAVGEPIGDAQGNQGLGEEDNREDEGRGRVGGEAPVARKRRGKKSKASRPD